MQRINSLTDNSLADHPWWVERWIDLLQSYRFKKRLERGWHYARGGNVLSIAFQGEKVIAQVQGTDPQPYTVTISLDPFTMEDWEYVVGTLATKAIYSAQLLAGEMPPEIEQVFATNGLSLFPFQLAEVNSACSCPDPQNPCKHVAAVYYLLGDRFREDPFVLFQLRGQTRQQILRSLRQQPAKTEIVTPAQSLPLAQPLPIPPASFWRYETPNSDIISRSRVASLELDNNMSQTPGDLWQVLPPLPLNKLEAELVKNYFQQVYQTVGRSLSSNSSLNSSSNNSADTNFKSP